jgi:hypothetical protein
MRPGARRTGDPCRWIRREPSRRCLGTTPRATPRRTMEHSIEAEVYWLRHANPGPNVRCPRRRRDFRLGRSRRGWAMLAVSMKKHGWQPGARRHRDLGRRRPLRSGLQAVPFGDGGMPSSESDRARSRTCPRTHRRAFSVEAIRTLMSRSDPAEPDLLDLAVRLLFNPVGMLVPQIMKALAPPSLSGCRSHATSVGAPGSQGTRRAWEKRRRRTPSLVAIRGRGGSQQVALPRPQGPGAYLCTMQKCIALRSPGPDTSHASSAP